MQDRLCDPDSLEHSLRVTTQLHLPSSRHADCGEDLWDAIDHMLLLHSRKCTEVSKQTLARQMLMKVRTLRKIADFGTRLSEMTVFTLETNMPLLGLLKSDDEM